jgi:hypothetical protein
MNFFKLATVEKRRGNVCRNPVIHSHRREVEKTTAVST